MVRTQYDSVVRHLKAEKRLIAKWPTLRDVPALRTPEERLALIKAELADATNPRPSTRKTLENKIRSVFNHPAEPDFVEKTIETLVQSGILDFTETDKIDYRAA